MKYLILSDVHANLEAMNAVLAHAEIQGWDKVVSLGDEVGYNSEPNEIMEVFRKFRDDNRLETMILGNHDKVAIGRCDANNFNDRARRSALWTQRVLDPEHRQWLETLNDTALVNSDILVVHGSPINPDGYISYAEEARDAFEEMEQTDSSIWLCFHGHTHVPVVHEKFDNILRRYTVTEDDYELKLSRSHRYLINPGSVGQPRDGNSKAAYAVYDDSVPMIRMFRVPYDIASVQEKIFNAGLPEINASRLSKGW